MSSVLGTSIARAPRTSRTKSLQANLIKSNFRFHYNAGETGPTVFSSASEVISFLDVFVDHVQNSSGDKDIQSAVMILCSNLKVYGPQLEASFKDQLDQAFICLRNASQDDKLDKPSRLHLLEIVELRAGQWNSQDSDSVAYYQRKLSEVEEYQGADMGTNNIHTVNSPHSSVLSGVAQQQSGATSPPPITPPPMLLPGEVIKSSGKYSSQGGLAKIPGKNFFKEEVVIRNTDSGKVMGIKGRRVHLIEEISDTVISFQRVSPGAKERLVQITGASEDNIDRARQLMEETIMRNASPTRNIEISNVSGEGGSAASADVIPCVPNDASEVLRGLDLKSRRQSMMEAALNEYRYSVNVGDQVISITSQNLDLVRVSKLVLDEYFSAMTEGDRVSPNVDGNRIKNEANPAVTEVKHTYKRDYLLLWSSSPLCKQPPPNFENVVLALPEIVRKVPNSQ